MRDKVLIIDDAQFNREMLAEMLEDEYTILFAEDGQKGIEMLEAYKDEICVILLDLVMPVMNGYDVLEIMKKRGYMDYIPVLVISGEQASDVERKCFDCGATDFIRKPFCGSRITMRVKNAIDLFRYRNSTEAQRKSYIKDTLIGILDHHSEDAETMKNEIQKLIEML